MVHIPFSEKIKFWAVISQNLGATWFKNEPLYGSDESLWHAV
jgi:hypothetical protein